MSLLRVCGFAGVLTWWVDSKVYVSFGGLLCMLEGPYKKLSPLKIEYVYMLLKK